MSTATASRVNIKPMKGTTVLPRANRKYLTVDDLPIDKAIDKMVQRPEFWEETLGQRRTDPNFRKNITAANNSVPFWEGVFAKIREAWRLLTDPAFWDKALVLLKKIGAVLVEIAAIVVTIVSVFP